MSTLLPRLVNPKVVNSRFIPRFEIILWVVPLTTPHLQRALLGAIACILLPAITLAQPLQSSAEERALSRFDEFETSEQERITTRIYQTILQLEHPLCQVAAELEDYARQLSPAQDWELDRCYDAEKYAPALKLKTRHWKRGSLLWKRAEKELLGAGNAVNRGNTWAWDYGRDQLVKPQKETPPKDQLKLMLAGSWPQASRLQAIAEARLDGNSELNQTADYFNHCYRDRKGNVFDELLLKDIWESGYELEVSDADAIAWLRLIKKSSKTTSPIPTAKQDLIYNHISNGFESFREYSSLRRALAARIVNPSGSLPWRFNGLEFDIDSAWAMIHHDFTQMQQIISQVNDRPQFFLEIDKRKEGIDVPPHNREGLPTLIRDTCLEIMREEGLLGLGRRF